MGQRSQKPEVRSRKKCGAVVVALWVLAAASVALAAEAPHGGGHAATAPKHGGSAAVAQEDHASGPVYSADDHWAEKVIVGVGAMFLAAMVIGPAYRAHLPEEIPLTHSHDEPPGTSGHHGKTGALDVHAPDGHLH